MEYQLSYGDLDGTMVTAQVIQDDGSVVDYSENAAESEPSRKLTVDRPTGKVTFPAAPGVPGIAGQDNVKITASKVREKYANSVQKARSAAVYAGCLFAAGAVKGMDCRSSFNDPTYWPDTAYDELGTDETDIIGYLPISSYLAVIKRTTIRTQRFICAKIQPLTAG